ncbi:disulfide reductase [candidate division WOR-3 bacterium JGI_Cruoil_03_51_56]|uniref:Disulfide reductase n=1 Tax=candidate division WOR-3 bacterium JGI_Cruoil_03_51_56 TaxID=1973747 RepID=A0A235BTS5_UNCW3|nr:MAG: disulfide reductase [candidate division WOR-3 bacterium JGI_Cruoil_03_51_56]
MKQIEKSAPRIGVYVCHCGTNIAQTVDVEAVAEYAGTLPNVVVARDNMYMCSDPGQALIRKDIKEHRLDRVVVAACSPRMHEPTFRGAVFGAGMNPYLFEMCNIREQCSWVHQDREKATQKASDLVRSSVARAALLEALKERYADVTKAALVLGGGIAGIQASLDIADAGYKVYLVERQPSIGGHMAQLDKTFPTLDCSACILTPKMVDVSRHKNIELITLGELKEVAGYVGNFKARVVQRARYVDIDGCTACNDCVDVCPQIHPDEFNMGLSTRKAIYQPFPQAVPGAFVLNLDDCLGKLPRPCEKCLEACDAKCINYDAEDKELELDVGAIVVATGMDVFDPLVLPELGYGKHEDILTGLEFERMLSAGGPTGGKIVRISNGKPPKDVVFVHCVGSRDKVCGNEYCSRICCMYIIKQAHLIKDRLPDTNVTSYYIDIRAFGKGFEEFYDRVREEGVLFKRGKPSEIFRRKDKLVVRAEDTLLGKVTEHETDMVILGVGLVPSEGYQELAQMLKLSLSPDRFFLEAHPKLRPVDSNIEGVYLAGCCQGPKDIPDTVAQAKAAASSVIALLNRGEVTIEPVVADIDEDLCSGCHVCEALCPYSALIYDPGREVMTVNQALCKGCGVCPSACPSGAITMRHYTDAQVEAQLDALTGHQSVAEKVEA